MSNLIEFPKHKIVNPAKTKGSKKDLKEIELSRKELSRELSEEVINALFLIAENANMIIEQNDLNRKKIILATEIIESIFYNSFNYKHRMDHVAEQLVELQDIPVE